LDFRQIAMEQARVRIGPNSPAQEVSRLAQKPSLLVVLSRWKVGHLSDQIFRLNEERHAGRVEAVGVLLPHPKAAQPKRRASGRATRQSEQ